jgi:hypothetical protein
MNLAVAGSVALFTYNREAELAKDGASAEPESEARN